MALRVRPANRDIPRSPDGNLSECWLIAEWPPGQPEPTDYWLSNLPADTPLRTLVRLAKIRWRIEHDYRELKHGLGLDYFEGRAYLGWHRHVTLTALAQAFCTQLRYDPKALRRPDPLRRTPRTPDPARRLERRLPHLPRTLQPPTTHPRAEVVSTRVVCGRPGDRRDVV
jgi:SRSO17 transposase